MGIFYWHSIFSYIIHSISKVYISVIPRYRNGTNFVSAFFFQVTVGACVQNDGNKLTKLEKLLKLTSNQHTPKPQTSIHSTFFLTTMTICHNWCSHNCFRYKKLCLCELLQPGWISSTHLHCAPSTYALRKAFTLPFWGVKVFFFFFLLSFDFLKLD